MLTVKSRNIVSVLLTSSVSSNTSDVSLSDVIFSSSNITFERTLLTVSSTTPTTSLTAFNSLTFDANLTRSDSYKSLIHWHVVYTSEVGDTKGVIWSYNAPSWLIRPCLLRTLTIIFWIQKKDMLIYLNLFLFKNPTYVGSPRYFPSNYARVVIVGKSIKWWIIGN